jgi:heat shock protein HslJ
MACSEEIMVQEQAYLANLESAGSYTVSSSTLTLTTAGGPLVYDAAIAVPLPAVLQ